MAAGELREETGLLAGRMIDAGEIFQGPGYCNQRGHIFLATDLSQGETEREVSEQDMVCQSFALGDFEAMIRDGTIREAMTISAFGLLRVKGLIQRDLGPRVVLCARSRRRASAMRHGRRTPPR